MQMSNCRSTCNLISWTKVRNYPHAFQNQVTWTPQKKVATEYGSLNICRKYYGVTKMTLNSERPTFTLCVLKTLLGFYFHCHCFEAGLSSAVLLSVNTTWHQRHLSGGVMLFNGDIRPTSLCMFGVNWKLNTTADFVSLQHEVKVLRKTLSVMPPRGLPLLGLKYTLLSK